MTVELQSQLSEATMRANFRSVATNTETFSAQAEALRANVSRARRANDTRRHTEISSPVAGSNTPNRRSFDRLALVANSMVSQRNEILCFVRIRCRGEQ